MSKLKEVLEVLGLEVGREFWLFKNGEKIPGRYHIADTGKLVVMRNMFAGDIHGSSMYSLYDLIVRDDLKLEPVPFAPKDEERFYTLRRDGKVIIVNFNPAMTLDCFRLATGFCFATKAEAEANKDTFMEMLKEIRRGAKLVLKREA